MPTERRDREHGPEGPDPFEVDEVVQQALDRLILLNNAADALGSTLDMETGLRRLCRTLVPGLADWCAVDLADGDGRLRRAATEYRGPAGPERALYEGTLPQGGDDSPAYLAQALRGTGPLLVPAVTTGAESADPLRRWETAVFADLRADTAVIAPIRSRGQTLGALSLVRTAAESPLTEELLALVDDLTHRVGLAVDNAALHQEIQHAAEHMQRSLLPDLPATDPVLLAARYQPAMTTSEVGGDWYDAFVLPEGAIALIIGDIAGHDLRAAVTMSHVRNMLRGIASDRKEPPGKILARLDEAQHILYPDQTLTCIYALLEKPGPGRRWQFHHAAAGHPAPLLVTAEGEARFLTGGRGMLLGVDPDQQRDADIEELPPESTVLLYTDGLIERRAETLDRAFTRLRRLAAALAGESLDAFCDGLVEGLAHDSGDDVALIAVRVPKAEEGPASATADEPGRDD